MQQRDLCVEYISAALKDLGKLLPLALHVSAFPFILLHVFLVAFWLSY